MDYTHKFSSGSIPMDKVIDEYLSLRKTRGYCKRCPNYGKYWSCPEFGFDEKILLQQFKYMVLIGREYTVPKKDRQKTIGIKACSDYCLEVNQIMKVESWKNLLELENDIPGVLTLMPGNCHICDLSGEGCARQKNQKCRHPDLMRFSLEALGFDVDAMCKFEIGLLLQWPREGHLPEKLAVVMAVLTNQKIPQEVLKHYFPDAKRSYLKAGETILGGDDAPKAKRLDSWLDHQAAELMQKEIEDDEDKQSWIGFKSNSLDSGEYVKNRTWAEGDDEYPDPPAAAPQEAAEETAPPAPAAPPEPEPQPEPAAAPQAEEGENAEEEEDSKYKWLGFKRSPEEAEEKMYSRPIPKFSLTDEEKAAQEAAEKAEAEAAQAEASGGSAPAPAQEAAPKPETPAPQAAHQPQPAAETKAQPQVHSDPRRAAMEKLLRSQMEGMSDDEAAAFLAAKLGIELDIPAQEPEAEAPAPVQPAPQPAPEPAVAAQPAPAPQPRREEPAPAPEPQPEPIEFLDAGKVDDVLGAALSIAQAVAASEPAPEPERPEPQAQPQEPAPAQTPAPEPQPEAEEDDSKYKWLGFKGSLQEEPETPEKGGWKKNY